MEKNTIKVKGTYHFEIKDKDGNIKDTWSVDNIVTYVGKAQLALLTGTSGTPFTYLAVGTSTTAVAATDTTLGAEITTLGLARAAGTVTRATVNQTNDTYQISYTWTATGSWTVQEAGVFNAASAGTMLSHVLTGTKSGAATDTLTATYQLTFS